MGPGLITGAADDDPSGIGTYSQAGAQFGMLFLWTALLTWPLMSAVQMACAQIGMVTGEGLASALRKKFPRWILILFTVALFLANTLNVGADLSAMADVTEMMGAGNSHFYVIAFALLITWATIRFSYARISKTLKWLAIFLFSYVIVTLKIGPDWTEAIKNTFLPTLPHTRDQWQMLVALLGTTISPYLFFWQASSEVEEEKKRGRKSIQARLGATPQELLDRRYDVIAGGFISNAVMFFIILATGLTLHQHGLTQIQTSKEAASALAPIAGSSAALLYSLGLLGVGFLAIPTLTGSAAYAFAETFRFKQGLDRTLEKARAFYLVIILSTIIGVILDFSNINPLQALYWSAVVNGLLAPVLLVGVFLILCDSKIMRGQPGSLRLKALLAVCTLLMAAAAIGMFL